MKAADANRSLLRFETFSSGGRSWSRHCSVRALTLGMVGLEDGQIPFHVPVIRRFNPLGQFRLRFFIGYDSIDLKPGPLLTQRRMVRN